MTVSVRKKPARRSVVVTAGPTREKIDPVRFISNYSTGIFGYEIAKEAARRGCKTTLISGPTSLPAPAAVKRVSVESASEMLEAVERAIRGADCLIMAAAVSDWRVRKPSAKKIRRGSGKFSLQLVENPDILAKIGRMRKKGLILVGFALESTGLEKNALRKLKAKRIDMVVANKVGKKSLPFGDNNIDIVIIDRSGRKTPVCGAAKRAAAKIILDKAFSFNI